MPNCRTIWTVTKSDICKISWNKVSVFLTFLGNSEGSVIFLINGSFLKDSGEETPQNQTELKQSINEHEKTPHNASTQDLTESR